MIFKLQQGGPIIPPFVSYTPVTVTGGQAGQETQESKAQGLIDKDMLKLIEKLDSLPSDTTAIIQQLQNFQIEEASGFNTSNMTSKYLQIVGNMSKAKFNRKQYEEAFNIAKTNGGINEVAIDDRGQVFCMNKEGDFKLLSPENIQDSGYVPLTNSELLDYRAYAPSMAYKNSILKVVSNSIGMESVTKMIQNSIANLGTTSTTQEGYAKTEATQLLQGLEQFMVAARKSNDYNPTLDNLYKGKLLTESQAMQAQQALSYLYRTLPENAKSLLKLKTKSGTDKEAVELVSQLIDSTLSNKSQFTLDIDTPDKGKKDGSSDGSNKGFKLDPVSLLLSGRGQKEKAIIQTAAGKNMGLEVPAVKMSITKDKKAIGSQATLQDVTASDFGGTFDWNNVSMGDATIKTNALDQILVDGNSLRAAYLPVDVEAYNNDGTIRPDINMLGRYKKALKKIEDEGITDPKEINKIYLDYKLPIIYTPNGDVTTNYIKFGIINGEAMSTAFSKDASLAEWLTEVIDENEINNTLNILNKGRKDGNLLEYDQNDKWGLFEGSYNNMYRGTIFIPINTDYFTATSTAGNPVTPAQADQIEAAQQAMERSKGYINPGNTL